MTVQTQTDFQFVEDGIINANLRFVDAKTKEVIRPQSVILQLNQNPAFTSKPDKEGWINVKLNISPNAALRALFAEMTGNGRDFKQYLRIPYPEKDFDVTFYPEGGNLIAGQPSDVAFKALGSDGNALDIKGEVTDSKGNKITEFKTIHDGMGEFFINPQPDEHYQAICHNGDRTLKFDLQEAQLHAIALKTIIRDNKLQVTVNKSGSVSFPNLYLIIHSRGSIVYAKAWDSEKDYITFDTSVFP